MASHQMDANNKICIVCHHHKDYILHHLTYCNEAPAFKTEFLSVRQLELMYLITQGTNQIPSLQKRIDESIAAHESLKKRVKDAQTEIDEVRKDLKLREESLLSLKTELEESLERPSQLVLPSITKEPDADAIGRSE